LLVISLPHVGFPFRDIGITDGSRRIIG
jgi:hypothetical protein